MFPLNHFINGHLSIKICTASILVVYHCFMAVVIVSQNPLSLLRV